MNIIRILALGIGLAGSLMFLGAFLASWIGPHTVVFGDYVGFAYAAYLLFVFAALGDILLNRARITVAVLDGIFGGRCSLNPC